MICPICFKEVIGFASSLSFDDYGVFTTSYGCRSCIFIHIDQQGRIAYIGSFKDRASISRNHQLVIQSINISVPFTSFLPSSLDNALQEAYDFVQRYIKLAAFN